MDLTQFEVNYAWQYKMYQ